MKAVYWQHHARLEAPSLVHDMHDLGYGMSERTAGRILKKLGLHGKIARKYKHTTDSNHRLPTAPNLLDRQFTVMQPNKVWTTDITYIRTKEGWLYLYVMLDLFSRRIIGWRTSHPIDRNWCVTRLIMHWLVRVIQRVSWYIRIKVPSTVVVILEHYH